MRATRVRESGNPTALLGALSLWTTLLERTFLHPLLRSRWSPTRFEPSKDVTEVEVESLLEAARWAPSAGNSQPWAFILGRPDGQPVGHLVDGLPTRHSWPKGSMILPPLLWAEL